MSVVNGFYVSSEGEFSAQGIYSTGRGLIIAHIQERRLRVLENRVLRRIFGHKRDEVTGEWRRIRNEELNDLYSSPYIIRVIKSKRMRWAGHAARMGDRRGTYMLQM